MNYSTDMFYELQIESVMPGPLEFRENLSSKAIH